uniref:Uncharacterized XB5967085 n=1 Tax=Xenopus tropicalis TaxID=8364 RepID=A0A803K096_XENTR
MREQNMRQLCHNPTTDRYSLFSFYFITVRATTKHSVTKPAAAQGLKCYSCNAPPPNCYKKKIITCEPGQDRCVKTTTKIVDYDGSPNEKNEFDKFMNVLVWERVCMTAKECEAYKQRTKIRDVTCCNTNLCNA